jgi:hypothetical protein
MPRLGWHQTGLICSFDCNGAIGGAGFRITIFDNWARRGDNLKPRLERVVVAGE